MNREAWLTELAKRVEPFFRGFKLAPYRLTCGWPCKAALSKKAMRIGECHALESSRGGVHEIFVSPILDEPIIVAGTVAHEMAHVAAGIKAGHGKGFLDVCRHVGLTKGKPASIGPGSALTVALALIIAELGPYPHQALVGSERPAKPPTVTGLTCPNCGCRVVIALRWLKESGTPVCGCGSTFELTPPGRVADASTSPPPLLDNQGW